MFFLVGWKGVFFPEGAFILCNFQATSNQQQTSGSYSR